MGGCKTHFGVARSTHLFRGGVSPNVLAGNIALSCRVRDNLGFRLFPKFLIEIEPC